LTITIAQYFARRDAKRVLLLEMQRSDAAGTCYRISSVPYATLSSDTPESVLYSPIIRKGGLPELRRTLAEPFDGGASTGFGTISLTRGRAAYTTTAGAQGVADMAVPRGCRITLRVAAPRSEFPTADAIVLAVGQAARQGGSSDGGRTIEFVDGSRDIAERVLTVAADGGPWCFGRCRNVTPVLKTPSTLEYAVNGGRRISGVPQVYDDGVPLASGAWTVSATTGTFTLTNAPVGTITCDVDGEAPSGSWLTSSAQIIGRILDLAGVSGIARLVTLPSGTIGYVIPQTTTVGAALDDLAKGCAGFWLVDRDGDFIAEQYPLPASGGPVFDVNGVVSEVDWSEWQRRLNPVRFAYRKNWTQQQAKPDTTAGHAAFVASPGLTGSSTATPDAEVIYTESPLLQTWFDGLSDAQAVGDRMLQLYSVQRRQLSVTLPYTATLDIGSTLSLTFGGTTYHCAVVAVSDVFASGYPVQRLTLVS
jgi:hypothetical protein